MDINEIRDYFIDQHVEVGFEPDEYRVTAVPKHIRYLLMKQIISLYPSDEMIDETFEEVLQLYFEGLPSIISSAYHFDESRKVFEKAIRSTIKQFWPRKHTPISDEYYRIYDIVSEIAKPMEIWRKEFYVEQIPFYIEEAYQLTESPTYFQIIEILFEDHLPPVAHMWEIETIIRESLEKLKA